MTSTSSPDYAALIERLDAISRIATLGATAKTAGEAAQALKALLAERDAAQSLADDRAGLMEQGNRIMEGARTELARVQAERDALREALAAIDAELDRQVYGLPPRSDPTPYSMREADQDIPPDYQHDVTVTEALWVKIRKAISASPASEKGGKRGAISDAVDIGLFEPHSYHRHKKTGGTYYAMRVAREEATLTPVVVYCAVNPLTWELSQDPLHNWTRPLAEFMDGRFECIQLAASPSPENLKAAHANNEQYISRLAIAMCRAHCKFEHPNKVPLSWNDTPNSYWSMRAQETVTQMLSVGSVPPDSLKASQERDERLQKLHGSRNEALMAYSARERAMIDKLEQIATGRTDCGALTDLDIARELAFEALHAVGWPTVRDCKEAPGEKP